MEILKKAWIVIPHWYDGAECGDIDPVYADTAPKAKYQLYLDMDSSCHNHDEFWLYKAHRLREMDLLSQPRHALCHLITTNQIELMAHCYGMDGKEPGYRNYFHSDLDNEWEDLCRKNMAKRRTMGDNWSCDYNYSLTELGINVVKSTRPIPREYYIKEQQ